MGLTFSAELLSALFTFIITLTLVSVLRPLAKHLDLVDKPGGRKCHQGDIPLIGGIAMVCGFLAGLLTLPISLFTLRSYLLGLMILLVTGVLDDLHELTPRARLAAQCLAALVVMIWGHVILYSIGHIGGGAVHHLGWFAWPFSCLAIVGTINALNMLDGVDGQASGVSLIAFGAMMILAFQAGRVNEMSVLLLLTMATLAFMLVNTPWPRHKVTVFMGDAGSMALGFSLVYFSITLSQPPMPAFMPAAILWLLIVPVSDIMYVTLTRLFKGRSPLKGGRDHIHHLLLESGCSPQQALLWTLFLSLIGAMVAVVATHYHWDDNGLFWLFIAWLISYCVFVHTRWRKLRKSRDDSWRSRDDS